MFLGIKNKCIMRGTGKTSALCEELETIAAELETAAAPTVPREFTDASAVGNCSAGFGTVGAAAELE